MQVSTHMLLYLHTYIHTIHICIPRHTSSGPVEENAGEASKEND